MRLICPKCDAQYDIADDVIPPGGRDVQCSSCSHTWYQMDKPKVAGRTPVPDLPTAKREPEPRPQTAGGYDAPTHAPKPAPRRPLDSSIADILREEAALEEKIRAPSAVPKPPETERAPRVEQPLDMEATRRRVAQVAEDAGATPAAIAAAATGATGTNLRSVPDIHEINAALRARAEASDTSGLTEGEKQEAKKRRGFRRGFFFVLILIAVLITPYFFVEEITEAMPNLTDTMNDYVRIVDSLRVWLDEQVQMVRGLVDEYMNSGGDAPSDVPEDPAPANS